MATKVHQVRNYNYSFDARLGGPGKLQLWGKIGLISEVRFVNENSSVPEPILSPDLNSATIVLKNSNLTDLIKMLRGKTPVSVTINDQGLVTIHNTYGLADCLVVCPSCACDLLEAKTQGIKEAMQLLVNFCGADAIPELCPVTFHLCSDSYCGTYQSGTTGYFSRDPSGFGHICLYDLEKENRSLPFTVENAQKIEDQLLVVHEAMHGWFVGRQHNYLIQEPFCKLTSFIISGLEGITDYCDFFRLTPNNHPHVLMKYLCELGMNKNRASEILAKLAQSAADKGSALTETEFADIVTAVLGINSVPAFQSAGILP